MLWRLDRKKKAKKTPDVAIIGLSGRFPGANSIEQYWKNLCEGKESITFFTAEDLLEAGIPPTVCHDPHYVKASPILDNIDWFDAEFFQYSPREAEAIDPQQRLLLECAWKTLENAGYPPQTNSNKIAMFCGSGGIVTSYFLDYLNENPSVKGATASFQHLGNDKDFVPTRVSYKLNLKGPSVAIQTACSTSLVTVHLACQSLINDECDMALAGGVNVRIPQCSGYLRQKGDVFSIDGHCRPFDANATGIVFGSGIGLVLLKPLARATADRDFIYAVIKGSAINNDGGDKVSYTASSSHGQFNCISSALNMAKINPETLGYIEAHGTGTAMGDPVEIAALTQIFRKYTQKKQCCAIGSVKANVGHLEIASGIASLIKTVLMLHHKKIPPIINFETPNSKINFKDSPFYINKELVEWLQVNEIRRAGVNSLGIGGTNAFVVLEEFSLKKKTNNYVNKSSYLIALSAKNERALKQKIDDLLEWLISQNEKRTEELNLADISYTLNVGRCHFEKRYAFVVCSINELLEILCLININELPDNVITNLTTDSPEQQNSAIQNQDTLQAMSNAIVQNLIKIKRITPEEYRNKLLKLANLYIAGCDLDWETLHYGESKQRIALPTYPFAKMRHWVTTTSSASLTKASISLHPLLDQHFTTGQKQYFTKLLTGQEFFLKDHHVKNIPVVPGVIHLEMVRAAAMLASPQQYCIGLRDMIWVSPIQITHQAREIRISFYTENGNINFAVTSIELNRKTTQNDTDSATDILHAKGSVIYAAQDISIVKPQQLNLAAIRKRCTQQENKDQIYARFHSAGYFQGPTFQSVQEFLSNDREMLAKLQLPRQLEQEAQQFNLHPSMMDGAVQAVLGWIIYQHPNLYLPLGIGQLDVFGSVPNVCYAYVTLVAESEKTALPKFQVQIVDEAGHVIINMTDFTARPAKSFSNVNIFTPETLLPSYYRPRWVLSPLPLRAQVPVNVSQRVLIIAPSENNTLSEALAKIYYPGEIIHLCWAKGAAWLESLKKLEPVDTIYFVNQALLSEKTQIADVTKDEALLALFYCLKTIIEIRWVARELTFKLLTLNAHHIEKKAENNPWAASLLGLTYAFAHEYLHLLVSCVDIATQSIGDEKWLARLAHAIAREPAQKTAMGVALHNGKRYVRVLEPVIFSQPISHSPFRKHGTYFIVGGAGGIGFAVSEHLARVYQARLVWIGRQREEIYCDKIEKIRSLGGEVLYCQTDVADRKGMQAAVMQAKSRFECIHGAIHSALVLKDKTLARMEEETFQAALTPKLAGSVILAEVLQQEPLDFLLFFSSMQSFLGNAGQSNYAAGSTFQDAVAHLLQHGCMYPVKLINWGYWGNVGVVATPDYQQRMAAQGILSIEPAEGIEAVYRVLTAPLPQLAFFKAQGNFLANLGIDHTFTVMSAAETLPSCVDTVAATIYQDSLLLPESYQLGFTALNAWSQELLLFIFQQMGVFREPQQHYSLEKLAGDLSIIPTYERLLVALVDILMRSGHLQMNGIEFALVKKERVRLPNSLEILNQKKLQLIQQYPELHTHIELLWTCILAYPRVLMSQQSHMEVMFPQGSFSLVAGIYQGSLVTDYYNQQIAYTIRAYIQQRLRQNPHAQLILLEIGAGTGGTSAGIFKALDDIKAPVHYIYTDISLGFINHGKERWQAQYPWISFQQLNIEEPPEKQGFALHSVDLVLASNVLHATKRMETTLQQVKHLLKTKGLLLLNELSLRRDFDTLTFGLTEGWWCFEDVEYRIPLSPLLTRHQWQQVLEQAGFRLVPVGDPALSLDGKTGQQILLAESDGVILVHRPLPISPFVMNTSAASSPEKITALERTTVPPPVVNDFNLLAIPAETARIAANLLEEKTRECIKTIFSQTLKINSALLEDEVTFENFGVDSLLVLELNKNLQDLFGQLSTTLLFEHNTINRLVSYFIQAHASLLEKKFNIVTPQNELGVIHHDLVNSDVTVIKSLESVENRTIEKKLLSPQNRQDIAIIGLAGRYPNAENLQAFWELLQQGQHVITEIPTDRWDWRLHFDPTPGVAGKSYNKWGGFIKDCDKFDPLFFNISPREAEGMDPQERLFLEIVWATLEDAGYTCQALGAERKVGVFVGVMHTDYSLYRKQEEGGEEYHNLSAFWSIANRISYYFDFLGPSMAVDTACSSSLTAVHMACESLQRGECELSITGGVNLILHPNHHKVLCQLNMLSRGDACKAFGADADGIVIGEGVGAVLLKPLAQAKQDGDRIYGVIKGTAINAGGKTSGYMVPNPTLQAALVQKAIDKARVEPASINYIETHGTGTTLGDPIEVAALTKVIGQRQREISCAIGSVKSNIGHLESAAGIAALTKVLLQFQHKQLVPSLHAETLNPNIDFEHTPFYVQRELSEWKKVNEYPRRAGISSFGAGGSNAHIIVEEGPEQVLSHVQTKPYYLVTFSAKHPESLQQRIKDLHQFLIQQPATPLEALVYTLNTGREHFKHRIALVVSSAEELQEMLAQIEETQKPQDYFQGNASQEPEDKVIYDEVLNVLIEKLRVTCLTNKEQYKKHLLALANFYVKGYELDWTLLHQTEAKQKIHLPTYSFLKEHYWIPETKNKPTAITSADFVPTLNLHPLIGWNASTFLEQNFRTLLKGDECYLVDHLILGQKILPGMIYLEMARAAGELALPGSQVIKIQDVLWLVPLQIADTEIEVSIRLEKQNNQVHYSIYTINGNEEIKHGQGVLIYGKPTAQNAWLTLSALEERFTQHHNKEDLYQRFAKVGLHYGKTLQALEWIKTDGEELLGYYCLPAEVNKYTEVYKLHPSILDGALQTCMALNLVKDEAELKLPFALEDLTFLRQLPQRGYVHLKQMKSSLNFSLQILDNQGEVCLELTGLSVRPMMRSTSKQIPATLSYYCPQWKNSTSQEDITTISALKSLCVISEDTSFVEQIRLQVPDLPVFQLQRGLEYTRLDQYTYQVRGGNVQDYQAIIQDIQQQQIMLSHFILCKSFASVSQDTIHYIDTILHETVLLIQSIIHANVKSELHFIVPYYCDEIALTPEIMFTGFGKSLQQEHPQYKWQMIGFDKNLSLLLKTKLLLVELSYSSDFHVRYVSENRQVEHYVPLVNESMDSSNSIPLRWQGVYLITGGLGGLGFIFANYLAKTYQAKLILTGRSALTSAKYDQLKQLENLGAAVLYLQGDVADAATVETWVTTAKLRFGCLHGVIHSAGIIADGLLLQKQWSTFQSVLLPKIKGILLLDAATQKESLDCFVLFSSLSSCLGNAGQTDYATANAFLDHFANWRAKQQQTGHRQGKSIAINWPLWYESGMRVDKRTEVQLEKRWGLLPMLKELGLQAFTDSLNKPTSQVMVFYGHLQRIAQILQTPTCSKSPIATAHVLLEQTFNDQNTPAEVKTKIVNLLLAVLHLPLEKMDMQKNFLEFGIDSVLGVEIIEKLNEIFRLKLSPALLFEYPTVEVLAVHIYEQISKPTELLLPSTNISKNLINIKAKLKDTDSSLSERFWTEENLDTFSEEEINSLYIVLTQEFDNLSLKEVQE